jgi:hypothetical protein
MASLLVAEVVHVAVVDDVALRIAVAGDERPVLVGDEVERPLERALRGGLGARQGAAAALVVGEAVEGVGVADVLAIDVEHHRPFGLQRRVAQVDGLADVLAGDLEEAAAPADGAVIADLAGLAVEKHVLEADVPGDRSQVVAAGQEVP